MTALASRSCFACGMKSFRILEDIDHARHVAGVEVEMIVRGSACENGVEVFGVALRGHQSLTASSRATVVVGKTRALIVEGFNESLRLHGHFMHRAVSEVLHLFGMTECELPVGFLMPRIVSRRGISAAKSMRPSVAWLPVARQVPESILPIRRFPRPGICRSICRRGKPEFHVDQGVGGRTKHRDNATVRGRNDRARRRRCAFASRAAFRGRRASWSGGRASAGSGYGL